LPEVTFPDNGMDGWKVLSLQGLIAHSACKLF